MTHKSVEAVRLPWISLLCAIIEQSAEDVRFGKRNGYVNDDQSILHIGTTGGQKNAAFLFVQDAYEFFRDGRVERVVCLIDSPIIHADRLKKQVLNGISLRHEKGFRIADGSKKGIPCEKELTVVQGGRRSG